MKIVEFGDIVTSNKERGRAIILSIDRQQKIYDEIRIKGSIRISHLIQDLNTSESTIRRDLEELEKQGLIKRVHGGAILPQHVSIEPSILDKSVMFSEEKDKIGKFAATLVEEHTSIIVDSGTTTACFARHLQIPNLTILTNGINIADILSSKQYNILLTGGLLKTNTQAMVGELAIETLSRFHVDICFLAINAISEDIGLSTPDYQEAWVKKAMIEAAEKVILLIDSSKFGKVNLTRVADLGNIDMVVTDEGISKEYIQWLESHDVKVYVV
ncbi:DeoR/GlpR family DNA-binding transcription regulator [Fodinisporobacter ferrooxydans]|uniref:DeoR/GlpR family DNA-binding transcription regulator n=1 Tax=Fodinisporobacter ferrooxydans TaxID=2901836 RepID=A0ABY4CQ30_9BACL|nr:DeoR/GlpR family DNA-binding transcription regulator [Alicyclobacillaceae bacterium MYW30-H2]